MGVTLDSPGRVWSMIFEMIASGVPSSAKPVATVRLMSRIMNLWVGGIQGLYSRRGRDGRCFFDVPAGPGATERKARTEWH